MGARKYSVSYRVTTQCQEIRVTQLWPLTAPNANQVWWDNSLLFCSKFIAKSVSERILKIGQHLAKLEAKNIVATFSGQLCIKIQHASSPNMFIEVNKNYFEYHKCVDIMCIDITKGRRNSMDFVYTDQHGVTKIFKMLSPLRDGVIYSGVFSVFVSTSFLTP